MVLTFVDTVVHLGHTLSCNLSDSEDIEIKTQDFIQRANRLLLNFGVCSVDAVKAYRHGLTKHSKFSQQIVGGCIIISQFYAF